MSEKIIFGLGMLCAVILDLICEPIRNKWAKQCNYNCNKCKVWDCRKKICNYKEMKNKMKN